MYVVSCRKDFESNIIVSGENQYRNYFNPGSHKEHRAVVLDTILKAAANKHVCILVHGFNNPLENVMKSYWELVKGLDRPGMRPPEGYGLIVGFTWPGSRFGLGYFGARPKAERSGARLRELINGLRGVALSVDVQTHSLGARVALHALADPKNKTFVDNLLLAAAAVDDNILEPDHKYFSAMASCNRCLAYFSKKDPVLGGAFWVGDVLDGIHAALGLRGPRRKDITMDKTPNLYVIDCSAVVHSHGGYRDQPAYYAHWTSVLAGGPLSRYDELS
ncbi:MAG TPA: alpha/beta hydrolase [Bryobacteraceae bacterium]|nr:alpha/beta hydrolase [Bryobacteraceae bacterium]